MKTLLLNRKWKCALRRLRRLLCVLAAAIVLTGPARADEPYARSHDYDLQHSKIALKFDIEQKKVIGDVTHTLSILKDDTEKLEFDSVGLTIQSVTVNKTATKFETTDKKLIVPLASAAKKGDKFEVEIKYEGKTTKGAYFILPDKDYPEPAKANLDPGRVGRHALLPADLRLSQRPADHRDDFNRAGGLGDRRKRKTDQCERRRQRNENVDLAGERFRVRRI